MKNEWVDVDLTIKEADSPEEARKAWREARGLQGIHEEIFGKPWKLNPVLPKTGDGR